MVTPIVTIFVTLSVTNQIHQFATLSIKRSIRVSANIISGQTRLGGTMKKISVPATITLLVATVLVSATLVAAASAKKELLFKGSLKAVETYQPNLPVISVTATGSGEATQLGNFTVSYQVEVNVQTGAGNGLSAEFVAANGDRLFAEGAGQASPTEIPGTLNIVEHYTITGGTGRFANASGTFTVERVANQATGETSGTLSGNIVIP
jgi:hypothetical protein